MGEVNFGLRGENCLVSPVDDQNIEHEAYAIILGLIIVEISLYIIKDGNQ